MNLRIKALLCWGLLIPLAVLNPTPTGGALLLIAPLAIYTYHTTKDWLNEIKTRHVKEAGTQAGEDAEEATAS